MAFDLPEIDAVTEPGEGAEPHTPRHRHRHRSSRRRLNRQRRRRRRLQNLVLAALSIVVVGILASKLLNYGRRSGREVVLATLGGRSITNLDLEAWLGQRLHGDVQSNPDLTPQFAAYAFDEFLLDNAGLAEAARLGIERGAQGPAGPGESAPVLSPLQNRAGPILGELRDLVTDGVQVTPDEVHEEFLRLNRRARIAYVFFDSTRYTQDVPEDPGALEAYFADNFIHYRMPEQRALRYVVIDASNAAMLMTAWRNESNNGARQALDANWLGNGKSWLSDWVDGELKADPNHFELVAAKLGLETKETPLFEFGQALPEFGYNQELARRAFQIGPEDVTEPVTVGDSVVIAHLSRLLPAHGQLLSAVRPQVERDYRANWARILMEQRAHEFALKAKTGDFRSVAAGLGLQVEDSPEFTFRDPLSKQIPGSELGDAFTLQPGATSDVISVGSNCVVFQVLSHRAADDSGFAAQRGRIESELLDRQREIAWQVYRHELWQRLTDEGEAAVNRLALQQVVAKFAGS